MKEKLQQVKEHIKNHKDMSEEEKSNTIQKIDEWLLEDKADGTIVAELTELSKKVIPILEEIGLL
jgi:DNA-binding transcriptional MerR regulator